MFDLCVLNKITQVPNEGMHSYKIKVLRSLCFALGYWCALAGDKNS